MYFTNLPFDWKDPHLWLNNKYNSYTYQVCAVPIYMCKHNMPGEGATKLDLVGSNFRIFNIYHSHASKISTSRLVSKNKDYGPSSVF